MRRRQSTPESTGDGVADPLFRCCWWCWHEPGDASHHAFIGRWSRVRDEYGNKHGLKRHEVPRAAGFVACPDHQADYDAFRASQGLLPKPFVDRMPWTWAERTADPEGWRRRQGVTRPDGSA